MMFQAEEIRMAYLLMLWIFRAYDIHTSLPATVSTVIDPESTGTHLLTTEHPSQNFLTLDLTFIPLNWPINDVDTAFD
jgi:hypothetical protein